MVSICRNYDNYRNTITIVTKDTYNFDKTGFQIGVIITTKILNLLKLNLQDLSNYVALAVLNLAGYLSINLEIGIRLLL
jgi:hypothetical protein